MSETTTALTPRHLAYMAAHSAPEDAFLKSLKRAALTAGIPPIWVAPEEASFMQILLRAAGARRVVEVGTLAGSSAIAMARALPASGRVKTIEIHPAYAAFARKWIAKSDVAKRIQVLEGDARKILPRLKTGEADAIFLDADKISYPFYLQQALRIVRKGGLVLADNAFAFGQLFETHPTDREVKDIRAFNERIIRTKGLQCVIVPLGDGLWVGVRV